MEIKGSESERGREGWKRSSSDEVGTQTSLLYRFEQRLLVSVISACSPPQPSVTCCAKKVDPTPKAFLSPGVKIWTARKEGPWQVEWP